MNKPLVIDDVANQPPPFENINLFSSDMALQEALTREGGGHALTALVAFGAACGSAETIEQAWTLEDYPPRLRSVDVHGRLTDRIEHHPAYHEILKMNVAEGLHYSASVHDRNGAAHGRQVARAAALYLASQVSAAHCQTISLTHAAVPAIAAQSELAADWLPKILSRDYDPRPLPVERKRSVLIGIGVPEKHSAGDAGCPVRAEPDPEREGRFALHGQRCSLIAPTSDAFLMVAETSAGPSCFLVPRLRGNGETNGIGILRLKDRLGCSAVACAEVELHGAEGWLLGTEGEDEKVLSETIMQLRMDLAVISAGAMRRALAQTIHRAEHRYVRGVRLIDQPLMSQVLADLALDVEAALALVLRLARSFDRAEDARAAAWRRLMTPVTKYWVCKIAPGVLAEAMECVGDAYAEDQTLARIYRDAPVQMLWKGTGNDLAQEVLWVLQREPEAAEIVMEELAKALGEDPYLMAAHARLDSILCEPRRLDLRARSLVEGLAVLAAGTILRAHAPAAISEGFIATRMGSLPCQTYGQELDWADTAAILERASPNR